MTAEREQLQKALQNIVDTADKTKAVYWAVNYARRGIGLMAQGFDDSVLKVQCLYVLDNITRWRGPVAKETRQVLKDFVKNH